MKSDLSDVYVNQIKWNLRNNHAAVLVGSGFSRNADCVNGTGRHMPDWCRLADEFSIKLGVNPEHKDNRYANPLSLAQQVIEVYGRTYMNNLIREQMDDDSYAPGLVHELLISLPWTDIFTTNYDTLLERAVQNGTKRIYKVVYNRDDLIYSAGVSRIVKLHGSLPSHEPFIISEEDYRRYPKEFAPFVNTVQQSLLENIFVLIGFSGDDPNFLNWIGWIHDNIGLDKSPKMYMIVQKSVSEVIAKMLAAKNIEVVVLNDIEDYKDESYKNGGDSDESYKESIRKFLEDLNNYVRKVDEQTVWPMLFSVQHNSDISNVSQQLNNLQQTYPSWVTARYKCLYMAESLVSGLDFYIRRLGSKSNLEKKETALEIDVCDKFCWLCNITNTMISHYTIEALQNVLQRHLDNERDESFVRIEMYILKYCRVYGSNDWENVYNDLKHKLKSNKTWDDLYAELKYEYVMHLLYSFEWEQLEEAIKSIPCDPKQGEWILRKAGLLSMLGYHVEALSLLREGIEYARRIIIVNRKDNQYVYNRFLSLESSMIALFRYIQQAYDLSQGRIRGDDVGEKAIERAEKNSSDETTVRWSNQTLERSVGRDYINDYIWEVENEKYSNGVSDIYKPRPAVIKTPSFDLDKAIEKSQIREDELVKATQFFLFREVTGNPFRIGVVTNKEGVRGAISRSNWNNYRISILYAILEDDNKDIECTLTRTMLANMTSVQVNQITKELISLMDYCMEYVSVRDKASAFDTVIYDYVLSTVPEILSRLVTKCSSDVIKSIVELITRIYRFNRIAAIDNVNHLVERSINAMPYEVFEDVLDTLWRIDVMTEESQIHFKYPDPFLFAENKVLEFRTAHIYTIGDEQTVLFQKWIGKAAEEGMWEAVVSRLSCIYMIYRLPDVLNDSFKLLLWDSEHFDKYGLPDVDDGIKMNITDYPHDSDDKKLLDAIEHYIVDLYRDYIDKGILNLWKLSYKTAVLLQKIELNEEKCNSALELALGFCERLYEQYDSEANYGFFDARTMFECVDEFVGMLLLKSGVASADKTVNNSEVDRIIDILDKTDTPHALLSWCVSSENRYNGISLAILQGDVKYISNANKAMYRLVDCGIRVDDKMITLMADSIVTTLAYNVNSYAIGLELLVRKGLVDDSVLDTLSQAVPKFAKLTRVDLCDDDEDVIRKIGMRKVISILSKTIYQRCIIDGRDIPEGILFWKESVAENEGEFAEIRVVWDMELEMD